MQDCLISERLKPKTKLERNKLMDNGASSYLRFLEGDDNGIVEIIRDYKDGLMLFLNRYVNNIHIAEELAEDTFFKIVTRKPRFVAKYSFKTWLYIIGRNIAINYIKHAGKVSDISAVDLESIYSDEDILEKMYLQEERKIIVHRALSKIKADYSQVLYLKYFENLIYQAKQSMKSEFNKEGFNYEEL